MHPFGFRSLKAGKQTNSFGMVLITTINDDDQDDGDDDDDAGGGGGVHGDR